jgi:hypothetical protein
MNFLTPAALWFAAAIPVVVVFYLLKRKRVVKLVSSTMLWQRFLAETQANAPFQRLRHNWLLILQIILLLLVVLALCRPYFFGQNKESPLRVMIIDGSASMKSRDVSPSRFEQAKTEALQWVDGLRDQERIMILLAGANTEVKQSPTSDKTALRRAIQNCQPSDAPTRLADALKTAGAFTHEKRGEEEVMFGEIHLFSDGAVTDLEDLGNQNLPIIYYKIGLGNRNLGIVSMDVKSHPEDPEQRAIFASIANSSDAPFNTDVELHFNDQLLEVRALALEATNTQPLVFFAPQVVNGVFTVSLTAEDDLSTDNQASMVSLMPTPVRVLLLTEGNKFLEKALRSASPALELTVSDFVIDAADQYDLAVIDDTTPLVWPNINTMAIRSAPTNWFTGMAPIKNPPIVDWKSTHPLLRYVNFDNVQIAEAYRVDPPAWGIPLLESPSTPLLLVGEINQRRVVWTAFNPLQSTWPLRISYPIFMANAVDWLNPASQNTSQLQIQAGKPFRLNLYQTIAAATVTWPDGREENLPLAPDSREVVFGNTTQQGIYQLKAGTNETVFCVNLLDADESSIRPKDELPLGKYEQVAATTLKQANLELWRWIALGGLLVLLFEWWYYHKRTV